jgi:hypothetical protein
MGALTSQRGITLLKLTHQSLETGLNFPEAEAISVLCSQTTSSVYFSERAYHVMCRKLDV